VIDPSTSQPPSIEELQKLIPQLEILSFIGHGGMGTFYKARQPMMNRFVALKVFLVDPITDQELIEGFRREAKAMASLNHTNIVKIFDFGESGSILYLVMEFVPGDILERLIEFRGFGLQEMVTILTQVCDALEHAHNKGVVHRDLRPGNTMLDDSGKAIVGDFGLARFIGEELFRRDLTAANLAMGTLDYVAPEQHDPNAIIDHRADIFSVGLMFYKLATRTIPRGTFYPPSHFAPDQDPRIDGIVIRCMQRDPNNRYQSIRDLRADLEQLRPQVVVTNQPKLHIPSR
jgi:serine/threonine protein kinase